MPDHLPKFSNGESVTFGADADVTGGRLVQVSGPRRVVTAVDESKAVVGVAAFDATVNEPVTVYTRAGGVHPLVAASTITAGATVAAASAGRVKPALPESDVIGRALTGGAAGSIVEVLF